MTRRAAGQPRGADADGAGALPGDGRARRRPPRLHLLALRQGRRAPRTSIYNATKFGLRGFALGLRTDLGPQGVGVSLVSPGFIREAGMFADAGAKPPPGMGTGTPEQVGAAVVRAIERDKAEIVVAPLQQRALAHFALASPGISVGAAAAGQRRLRVAAGQTSGSRARRAGRSNGRYSNRRPIGPAIVEREAPHARRSLR